MRLILIIGLLGIVSNLYSQTERVILEPALESYKIILPKLEKHAFNTLRKLYNIKDKNLKNYHFIIIPMYKLRDDYINYRQGDTFAEKIDFYSIYDYFEAFVFKDTSYFGSINFSKKHASGLSTNDTCRYNISAFIANASLAKQILSFKPDMVFYPQWALYISFIKDGKLYVGIGENRMQPVESIIPFDDFIKYRPSFIQDLDDLKQPDIKRYRRVPVSKE